MRRFPLPDQRWILSADLPVRSSVSEIMSLLVVLEDDEQYNRIFNNVEDEYIKAIDHELLGDAFVVLLAYLLANWYAIPKPLSALEDLVLDFRATEEIWAGDGQLPERVAGISGIYEEFEEKIAAQISDRYRLLVESYVSALTKRDLR